MSSEATIVLRIKKYLKAERWLVWKNHGSQFSDKGLPDLMAVKDGRMIAIEVKRPGKAPTDAQKRWLRNLQLEGIDVGVATCVEDVDAIIARKHPQFGQ